MRLEDGREGKKNELIRGQGSTRSKRGWGPLCGMASKKQGWVRLEIELEDGTDRPMPCVLTH